MSRYRSFSSWLAPHFERFIALKRAGGARYRAQIYLLSAFDRFLCGHASKPPLEARVIVDYLKSLGHLSHQSRDNVVNIVWHAAEYARKHGAAIEPLPPRPARAARWSRQRQPRIVSVEEIRSIMAAARELPPRESLRASTFASLFGLLFTTGLRIGEALALDVGDLDFHSGILTVNRGKFDKARILPLRESVVGALERYVTHPKRPIGTACSAPLFVSGRCRRLGHTTVTYALRKVCLAAEIAAPHPRIHDTRHSFVLHRMVSWYSTGRDINAMLPALSTYLGHVSVENTVLYLRANGLLLEHACSRFESHTSSLDELS